MNKLVITTLAASLLLFTSTIAGAQTARARIAETPIRGEANLASAIVATLPEGGSVDVVDLQGDWYRVAVPNAEGKLRVGYVLAHLVEIVNADGSPQSIPAPPTSRAPRPVVQGALIPPTLAVRRDKATDREQALRAEVDALQADLKAMQSGQPIRQVPSARIPPPVSQSAQPREGIWFNGGFGFGSMCAGGCSGGLSGGSGGLSVGTTINDKLLLGVGTAGFYRSVNGVAQTAGTLDARIRFYPILTSGFFATGGLGLGNVSVANVTEYGVGAVLGVGWDIRIRPNVSLTPFWNRIGVSTSSINAGVGQFGLGITVH